MPRGNKKGRPKKPPKPIDGYSFYTLFERCEDCDLRDALSIVGKPKHDRDPHHRKLRKKVAVPLFRSSPRYVDDCENCKGIGYVKRRKRGDVMRPE